MNLRPACWLNQRRRAKRVTCGWCGTTRVRYLHLYGPEMDAWTAVCHRCEPLVDTVVSVHMPPLIWLLYGVTVGYVEDLIDWHEDVTRHLAAQVERTARRRTLAGGR